MWKHAVLTFSIAGTLAAQSDSVVVARPFPLNRVSLLDSPFRKAMEINRVFDILVDGQKIATQKLNSPKPGKFMDVNYPVPPAMTRGKQKVTVRFQAHKGALAGGIFGMRVIKGKQ